MINDNYVYKTSNIFAESYLNINKNIECLINNGNYPYLLLECLKLHYIC